MVALARRPKHLGAHHTPLGGAGQSPAAGRAPRAQAAAVGLRRARALEEARSSCPRHYPRLCGAKPAGREAGPSSFGLGPGPPARDGPRTHLGRAAGAAGGARKRRRSRGNEWSRRRLAGDPRPGPRRAARGCRGECGRLPATRDTRLLVGGPAAAHRALRRRDALAPQRLQPLRPRGARAHHESPRPPETRGPSSAPGTPPCLRLGSRVSRAPGRSQAEGEATIRNTPGHRVGKKRTLKSFILLIYLVLSPEATNITSARADNWAPSQKARKYSPTTGPEGSGQKK
ncbi:unnamed protein product [Rangifer tarandus platyrhynchus]|uniref:Uncharacterized protein n=1 Tax=Rangifer tarandus platyrhynchus TaxID=3082113 RepID=A0AC59YE36_RANTA